MPHSKLRITKNLNHLHVDGKKDNVLDTKELELHVKALLYKHRALHSRFGEIYGDQKVAWAQNLSAPAPQTRLFCSDSTEVDLRAKINQSLWTGPIRLAGTKVEVNYDTGSPDAVIEKGYYQPSESAEDTGKSWTNRYGDGTEAKASIWLDTVQVGDLPPISKVAIGKSEKDFLDDGAGHGIYGLSFPDMSFYAKQTPEAKPFLQRLQEEGVLDKNYFSFYIDEKDSELTFGEISDQAIAPPTWVPVLEKNSGFWAIDAHINHVQAFPFATDSGTTLVICASLDLLKAIFKPFADDVDIVEDGDQTIALLKKGAPIPKVYYKLGDLTILANEESILYARAPKAENRWALSIVCVPALAEMLGSKGVIAGDAFMRNVVTVHDLDNKRLGFAPTTQTIVSSRGHHHGGCSSSSSSSGSSTKAAVTHAEL